MSIQYEKYIILSGRGGLRFQGALFGYVDLLCILVGKRQQCLLKVTVLTVDRI